MRHQRGDDEAGETIWAPAEAHSVEHSLQDSVTINARASSAECLTLALWLSVLCMRSKAWLAARVSLRLARLPRTASSAQRSRRLRSTRAAAPVLLTHADVTKNIKYFSMGPKLRHLAVHPQLVRMLLPHRLRLSEPYQGTCKQHGR